MTLKETMIYLEANLMRLKDDIIFKGVKLSSKEKEQLTLEIVVMNQQVSAWREMLKTRNHLHHV